MKSKVFFSILNLIVIVKAALLATAVQPVILTLGAVMAALDLDVLDVQPIAWRNWKIFKSEKKESQQEETEETKEEEELQWSP